jgi:putative ABC transport system permease protein
MLLFFVLLKKKYKMLSYIKNTFTELSANKLRTGLSIMGISIGIFCIVAVFTVVDSLKSNIQNNLSSLGNDVLYINKFAWMPEDGAKEYPFWQYKARPQMKLNELKALTENIASIGFATILYNDATLMKSNTFGNSVTNGSVNAVSYDFNHLQNFEIEQGRYFTNSEMQNASNSILVGNTMAENLFGNINPIGQTIKMYGDNFTVIGLLKKRGKDITGFNFDQCVIAAYTKIKSLKNIENDKEEFSDNTIMVKPKKGYNFTEMCFEIKGKMRALRKIKPGAKNNFSFNYLSMIQGSIDSIFKMINGAGGFIGVFSLLVGAFGIANIMFVTVKERTSQIGLKKAIGAKKKVILLEFLFESITLSLIGGLIGIFLVFMFTFLAARFADFPITLTLSNFILGISISAIVGIIAGIIPAIKASNLNPVEAIRS